MKGLRTSLKKTVDLINVQLRHTRNILEARYYFGKGQLSGNMVTGVVLPVKQEGDIVLGGRVLRENALQGRVTGAATQLLPDDAGFVRTET